MTALHCILVLHRVKDHQGSGYFRSNASFIRSRQAHLPNIDEATPVEADPDEPAVLQAVDQVRCARCDTTGISLPLTMTHTHTRAHTHRF